MLVICFVPPKMVTSQTKSFQDFLLCSLVESTFSVHSSLLSVLWRWMKRSCCMACVLTLLASSCGFCIRPFQLSGHHGKKAFSICLGSVDSFWLRQLTSCFYPVFYLSACLISTCLLSELFSSAVSFTSCTVTVIFTKHGQTQYLFQCTFCFLQSHTGWLL